MKEQSDAQKAVSHYAALIESRWLEKAHVMNIVLFLFVGTLSERGTRDSVQTDLKERKRRTKRVSSMQKPAYEQFLKERRDVQKYVSNERR